MSRGSNWFCSSSQRERKNAPNRGGMALGLSYTDRNTGFRVRVSVTLLVVVV